ncbi:MAG: Nramp family divalent metal transporter [Verrucomicrobia bacterium]|nr:Nramp family divalent metal transporter [Verrucomicrobiota bacterium]
MTPPVSQTLPDVHRSVHVPSQSGFWRKLLAFVGPGYLVAVGYMDPGNWATDLAGGSKYNYSLLSVILLSSILAMFLQYLALKLGIATGADLAQLCRRHYGKKASVCLWIFAEIAIAACDLAEVLGSAIALNLLFHLPLLVGVVITTLDVLLLLLLQQKGFRYIEAIVITLIATIAGCFALELFFSKPEILPILHGFFPTATIVTDPGKLFIAMGIIGATVMPHNLYLHSSIVQTRRYPLDSMGKKEAIRFATIDSNIALTLALAVNAAILILAAATFYRAGRTDVAEIQDAFKLLTPMLGVAGAGTLFAVALLASGQNSTLTGTLAGQIIMEGFVHIRIAPWMRRLITRMLAIIPAFIVIAIAGEGATTRLLLLSQVVLSMQLSFAVIPLVQFTGNISIMGEFVNAVWVRLIGWVMAIVIAGLNLWLLIVQFRTGF